MTPLTSVLIVDDEPAIRDLLKRWMRSLGLDVRAASSAEEAIAALEMTPFDLAIIDVTVRNNGLWLAGELLRTHPETAVVLATGNVRAVEREAPPVADLLIKPFQRERLMLALDRGREWRRQALEEIEWHQHLAQDVEQAVIDVRFTVERGLELGQSEADVLSRLGRSRMPDVMEHSERVARYALSIAQELEIPAAHMVVLEQAARFHDIGKLAMPEPVLSKPSPLTRGEAAIMRGHVDAGAEILEATRTLKSAAPAVHASHEWYGGTGYPRQLAGHAIPLESRIIAVADAYDAMTHDRCYRTLLDSSEAAAELLRCIPNQFDPDIVGAFLNVLSRH